MAAFFLYGKQPTIVFTSGVVESLNELNSSVKSLSEGADISANELVCTGKGSRIEATSSGLNWRVGSSSIVRFDSEYDIFVHSGSVLVTTNKNNIKLRFSSRLSSATFSGSGTIIIEALENGGFKFIPLEADGSLNTPSNETKKVIGGQLLLVIGKPGKLGSAYDIDIMLLLQSSKLVNYFPSLLPTIDQIGLAIYVQQLKLKGKYDALIGDAKTENNLQIWGFGPNPKKD